MKPLLSGMTAGCAATLPMTIAMEAMHRHLPATERYPLPPREISDELMEKTGTADKLDEPQRIELALANHFAFGSFAGGFYPLLMGSISGPPALKGAGYGLGVWAGSYLGFIPALRLLTPATRHPPERNLLMITAHLIWGSVLGLLAERLADKPNR